MTSDQAEYEGIKEFFSRPGAVLARQGEDNFCVYRGNLDPASPIRCAIGCRLPDELYRPDYDTFQEGGMAFYVLQRDYPDVAEHFKGASRTFLCDVQSAHDGAASVDDFLRKLDSLAVDHNLIVK